MNPKKKSKELKRISRANLNGRYRLSMSVFLTVTLITADDCTELEIMDKSCVAARIMDRLLKM